MRKPLLLTLLCFICMVGAAEAKIIPLVIKSTFTNDLWYPLPVEQMKSAAVDTALMKISSTKKFAFLYDSKNRAKNPGSLSLAVTLVEPAESAQLTIKLSLPDNKGSYVSSASVSLGNKNHKQIYESLQELGGAAADQLNLSASDIENNDDNDKQSNIIYNEILLLNKNVIKLHNDLKEHKNTNTGSDITIYNNISDSAAGSHNKAIYTRLGKLDTIINKLDAHHNYVKKSNEVQNEKLDSIYSELQKLNIGSNTSNAPPDVRELTSFDIKLLPIVDSAIKLKYKKDFTGAANILSKVVKTKRISKLFKRAVEEEFFINLPLYEADTKKTELSYAFMDQVKGDKYEKTVSHIRSLYERVLKRPDVLFKKRAEIKQKLDTLMISADSMGAVVKMMRKNELFNLKTMLRVHMQRRMMGGYGRKDGMCPTDEQIEKVMRKASMKIFKLGSLKESRQWCDLLLTDDNNISEQIKFNYEEAIITDKSIPIATSSPSPSPPVKNKPASMSNMMIEQSLRNKVILFSNAISRYYKKNKILPKSISDIRCTDPFKRMEVACASAQKGGVFFINYDGDWVSVESYISDGEILKKCKATIPINMYDRRYGECENLDINAIPS